jgi:hypothetical protein
MTSEELAGAGLSPNKENVRGSEDVHSQEGNPVSVVVSDSENREDVEIRSEGEDLGDVDADPRDLIAVKRSKSIPPSFVFGESKVTMDLIREYEATGFFPVGDGRAPLDEQIPTPEPGEIVVSRDFFTYGLRFPCDPLLPAILEKFSVKIHQLSPNSFLELSKFFWIMKTFRCNFSADVFAHLFELVIEPGIIKIDDGQYYESHYTYCTFNKRRQNTRKGITRIQIAPCCKTNFSKDWSSYWFYVEVDMSKILDYEGPAFPLCSPIGELTATYCAPYNHRAVGFRNCESAFHLAGIILGGHDIIEEFVAANIWPISYGWAPTEIVTFNVNWAAQEVPFPHFGLQLRENQGADEFMEEVENKVNAMIGESTIYEYKAYKNLVKHKKRINRVFSKICGKRSFRSRRLGLNVKTPAVAVASCSAAPLKAPRRTSSKKGEKDVDETSSSAVCPERTRSLKSSKRKCKLSEGVSDVELQAASSLPDLVERRPRKL